MNNYSNDIFVLENCISMLDQDAIETFLLSKNFPWFFSDGTILKTDLETENNCIIQDGLNPFQFTHVVDGNSLSNSNVFAPVLNKITNLYQKNIEISKFKINLLTKLQNFNHHFPHSDIDNFEDSYLTALYYVNQSDGPTYIFNQFAPKKNNKVTCAVKIDPEKGKLVIFDSRRFHASSSPVFNDKRIVLNLIFKLLE